MIRFREVCVVLLVAVGTVHGAPIFKGAQDISATHRPLSNPNCSGTEQCPFWPTEFQAVMPTLAWLCSTDCSNVVSALRLEQLPSLHK
mmetsp:Transcript_2465/g.6712  ORF Transcript_2465/g.6712 Transcript_2465/m.6712 type:complete len:88 (-) Transcript_2465:578-841(-)